MFSRLLKIEVVQMSDFSFSGYFDQQLRQNLFTSWAHHLQQANIQFRPDIARVEVRSHLVTCRAYKYVVCNPCQSSPSLTILVSLWFIIISLVFFYLSKLLFSGFVQIKSNFVRDQNNSKYRDWTPWLYSKLLLLRYQIITNLFIVPFTKKWLPGSSLKALYVSLIICVSPSSSFMLS